jgi:dihydroorotate dehydrogenase
MWYRHFRRALFALDPERAHRLALQAARLTSRLPAMRPPGTPVKLMGLCFLNRVGLAAGFDKNAEAVEGLGRLGFGFIEIGTVTPRPQSGQQPPRLFRLSAKSALVNRLGFPNIGAQAVASRLTRRRYRGVLGINIGKNADTPVARAVDDYVACLRTLHPVAEYMAVNVSSPNTASLRELLDAERLEPLLTALLTERETALRSSGRHLPILLKVSPDLHADGLQAVAIIAMRSGIDGLIATNTTLQKDSTLAQGVSDGGGLSGAPLHPLTLSTVSALRAAAGPKMVIVGVGGIDSAEKALAMRRAGADLVQLYTGLVYQGPALIGQCVNALEQQSADVS